MLMIYGIKNCSTMKKAFDFFDKAAVSYEFFDYKKQTVDPQLLKKWIDQLGLDVVMNTRGTTWRKLTDEQRVQAQHMDGAINLLQAQPSMIKRPLITDATGTVRLVGFNVAAYQALLTELESSSKN